MKRSTLVTLVIILILAGLFLYLSMDREPAPLPEQAAEESITVVESPAAVENTEVDEPNTDAVATDTELVADETRIAIEGVNFAFDVSEIVVTEGETVTITFTSKEGFHDWVVDEFDAATEQVRAGEETSVTFVADTPGTYEYYCSVGNHREQGMVGTLTVLPSDA